ncbi:MAG: hypothetical protein LC721_10740, partial [Actinobacteria bacterium]|nr:hypothetical protein [Actinomycetota bacterium]
ILGYRGDPDNAASVRARRRRAGGTFETRPKGLQGIKVLLPVLGIVGVVCASRTRHVTNSL